VAAEWATGHLTDGTGAPFLTNLAGRNVSELVNDAVYVTSAYTPADTTRWAGMPPATMAAAIDLLAEILSNHGANPIG